jgi:hypothetical protein
VEPGSTPLDGDEGEVGEEWGEPLDERDEDLPEREELDCLSIGWEITGLGGRGLSDGLGSGTPPWVS